MSRCLRGFVGVVVQDCCDARKLFVGELVMTACPSSRSDTRAAQVTAQTHRAGRGIPAIDMRLCIRPRAARTSGVCKHSARLIRAMHCPPARSRARSSGHGRRGVAHDKVERQERPPSGTAAPHALRAAPHATQVAVSVHTRDGRACAAGLGRRARTAQGAPFATRTGKRSASSFSTEACLCGASIYAL